MLISARVGVCALAIAVDNTQVKGLIEQAIVPATEEKKLAIRKQHHVCARLGAENYKRGIYYQLLQHANETRC